MFRKWQCRKIISLEKYVLEKTSRMHSAYESARAKREKILSNSCVVLHFPKTNKATPLVLPGNQIIAQQRTA